MAMNFLNNVNLNLNQLKEVVIDRVTSDAALGTKTKGRFYYDDGTNRFKGCINSSSIKALAYTDDITLANLAGASDLRAIEKLTGTGVLKRTAEENTAETNWALVSDSITIGTTSIALGGSATDIEGLSTLKFTAKTSASASSTKVALEVVTVNGVEYLHTTLPLYSDNSITAGGINTNTGGGGGGASLNRFDGPWSEYTSTKATYALAASLGKDLHDRVTSLETSSVTIQESGAGNAYTSFTKTGNVVTFNKGATFATLDSDNKIPLSLLPDTILGQLVYGGTVNASNVATLTNNAKTKLGVTSDTITLTASGTYGSAKCEGLYFLMSADQASTASLSGKPMQTGDWLISTGTAWGKIDNTDAVTSVAGMTGAVTLKSLTIKVGGTALGSTYTGATARTYEFGAAAGKGVVTSIDDTSTDENVPTAAAVYKFVNGNYLSGITLTAGTGISISTTSATSGTFTSTISLTSAYQTDIANGVKAYNALTHTYNIANANLVNYVYTTTADFTSNKLVCALYDASDNLVYSDITIVKDGSNYKINVTFGGAISSTYRLVVIGL